MRPSSSLRPKSHCRGRHVHAESCGRDSFVMNDTWLLVDLLTTNLLDLGRSLHLRATGHRGTRETSWGWGLKTAGRVTLGSRQVKVVLGFASSERLEQPRPDVPGSRFPHLQGLVSSIVRPRDWEQGTRSYRRSHTWDGGKGFYRLTLPGQGNRTARSPFPGVSCPPVIEVQADDHGCVRPRRRFRRGVR